MFFRTHAATSPLSRFLIRGETRPKIFETEGYRFFYNNEHAPIHVHVRHADGEAVFIVEPDVTLRESVALHVRRLARAEEFIHEHIERIFKAWHEHLG